MFHGIGLPPGLAGLTPKEEGALVTGLNFSTFYLLLPLLIPVVIASYSIVGEKTGHTLEPVLATPVRVWELLTGKSLAVLLPTVLLTWIGSAVFAATTAMLTSTRVFALVITADWVMAVVLWTPALALIAIAAMVTISSHVNDVA